MPLLKIYAECFKESIGLISRCWLIIPAAIATFTVFLFISGATSGLGMAGGFIAGLFYIATLTLFYGWLSQAVRKEKLRWESLKEFDWSLFSALMSVGFILWIFNMLVSPFASTKETSWIFASISLALFVLLNVIPEVIYLKRYESMEGLKYSFNFIKENWVEWFIPFIILLAPLVLGRPSDFLASVSGIDPFSAGADPLLPARFIFSQITKMLDRNLGYLGYLAAFAVTIWFMIFRGMLFLKLDGTSRRQRSYTSRF
jgi:hypothetical protein